MNAAVVTPVMDWNKYTIDGWLEQFGAWCETVRMKGGDLPDGLHINQIYWLMREAGRKCQEASLTSVVRLMILRRIKCRHCYEAYCGQRRLIIKLSMRDVFD
ncbi:hypothetical protein BANRA_00008 [Acinetobacter baumannii]|nr:hypothetical protein BANRA_00008 [Acinetobacter baumannii]